MREPMVFLSFLALFTGVSLRLTLVFYDAEWRNVSLRGASDKTVSYAEEKPYLMCNQIIAVA